MAVLARVKFLQSLWGSLSVFSKCPVSQDQQISHFPYQVSFVELSVLSSSSLPLGIAEGKYTDGIVSYLSMVIVEEHHPNLITCVDTPSRFQCTMVRTCHGLWALMRHSPLCASSKCPGNASRRLRSYKKRHNPPLSMAGLIPTCYSSPAVPCGSTYVSVPVFPSAC